MTTGIIDTPVGLLLVTMGENGLQQVHFAGDTQARTGTPFAGEIADELEAYFSGSLRVFSTPVDLGGISDFTRKVLQATATIPYGQTVSYGEIARRIGMPGATQAVGNALGANPVPIVIPCHRVIRSDGSLGWFTGGAHIKRALLRLEGKSFPEQGTLPI